MEAEATESYEDIALEVEFMSCIVDKAQDLKVTESDSHFSAFTGVHPSKIKQGKLKFIDLVIPKDRESVLRQLCKKDSPYVYLDCYIKNKEGQYILVHCMGQNIPNSTLCRLALADVSQSEKETEKLKRRTESMTRLVDMVEGGVCVFKVNQDMQFSVMYMNLACCRIFGTAKGAYLNREYNLDELIYKDDKSTVYQAIGIAMATNKPIDLEIRVITSRNSFTWCKLNSAIQRYDEDGLPVFHAVFTDISKVKAAEQEADSERDIMVDIFKNLPGPLFFTNLKSPFKLEVVSMDFMRLIGYTRKEFFEELGGDLKKLIIPEELSIAENAFSSDSKDGDTAEVSYTITTKGGRKVRVVDRRSIIESRGEKSTLGILISSLVHI